HGRRRSIMATAKDPSLAAKAAVERAAETLRDLRIAEVVEQDVVIEDGKGEAYRTKVKVSFKFEGNAWQQARTTSTRRGGAIPALLAPCLKDADRRFSVLACRWCVGCEPLCSL